MSDDNRALQGGGRRVLVCGGRDFTDARYMDIHLGAFHRLFGISCVIHGDYRGADHMARDWAIANGIPEVPYPADWKQFKGAAGPIRNSRMLAEGKPDAVLAFPGGDGTADMVRKARAAGVEVLEYA